MLSAEELSLTYQDGETTVQAVRNVTITVEGKQMLGILGPSGSGKSSLLYLLSGLKPATCGRVCFEGRYYDRMQQREQITLRRKCFGFVFQQHFLVNYLTALENVLVTAPRWDSASIKRATTLLEDLGMAHLMHRYPHQLSGGERQRVAVARAICSEPLVIFADEPTAMLDQATGLTVMEMLSDYRRKGSVVVVTHDPRMLETADRIVRLRDGEIVDEGL